MSNYPEKFMSTTDYATLKNDDSAGPVSVSLPAQILTADQIVTNSVDIVVGTINANSRMRMASSKDGGDYYVTTVMTMNRTGQVAGPTDVPYNVYAYVGRISPTVVRLSIAVQNPYSEGMGMAFGTETVTLEISTFLSPFV